MKTSLLIKGIFVFALATLLYGCTEDRPPLKDITVDRQSVSMIIGNREAITALPVPTNASNQAFEWSSSNPEIVTVSRFGIIEAVEEGSATITVREGNIQKTIPVTVIDPIQVPAEVGAWGFDDAANLTKATTGQDLVAVGTGFTSIAGPNATNGAVTVARYSYFEVDHGIPLVPIALVPGLEGVTEYTLLFHIRAPVLGRWYTFYKTGPQSVGDGEIFINTNGQIGVGATGYSTARITANVWHKVVISVNLGSWIRFYLDGELIHTSNPINDRFVLRDVFLLFADNDGEDADIDVAEVVLWDEALDNDQVRKVQRTRP